MSRRLLEPPSVLICENDARELGSWRGRAYDIAMTSTRFVGSDLLFRDEERS